MNNEPNVHEVDSEIPENAVSIYGQNDAMDDFPVLKAFQQYIDAEQAKARKRMMVLCTFFGILMFVVISVFVVLLISVSSRNQTLNDRLVEFAMRDRGQPSGSAVVVQPPQDNSALLAMTTKIDELQRKLAENQVKAEKAAAEAAEKAKQEAIEAAKPKPPSPEELEIKRLKALLAAEKEKASAEREKQRQAELEAYRRKHYPELYGEKPQKKRKRLEREMKEADAEIDAILNDADAIRYFDDDEEDDDDVPQKPRRRMKKSAKKEQPAPSQEPAVDRYTIPVDVKGSSTNWSIPLD